jgi:hypothetical protein
VKNTSKSIKTAVKDVKSTVNEAVKTIPDQKIGPEKKKGFFKRVFEKKKEE